jgi:hypothetical protein
MGFFKKIFKPVSKVLDKIIPNEIKPALPYLAAFAPVFGPTAGMFGSTIGKRMLLSGGANILGQLSQEGNEGDINLLSAGLGALTGAMTTPATGPVIGSAGETITAAQPGAAEIFRTKATDIGTDTLRGKGLEFLAKGSDVLAAGSADPFSMAGLKAATLPATTATGDLMVAEGKRAEDAYKDALAAYEAEMGDGATDAGRALAIRTAMEAYGFLDDEIEDAISAAGYRAGGRVGFDSGGNWITKKSKNWITKKNKFDLADLESLQDDDDEEEDNEGMKWIQKKDSSGSNKWIQKKADGGRIGLRFGGIDSAVENIENQDVKESMKFASATSNMDIPMMEIVEQFELKFKRKPNSLAELKQFYKDKYGSQNIQEKLTETVRTTAAEGGLMNLGGKEMDMRGGGFIPIGKKERADDVPARLSKNEFVMTADAVRAAGGGSVNKGAKRMYEVMNKLEARA